jgi:hypothetical protein
MTPSGTGGDCSQRMGVVWTSSLPDIVRLPAINAGQIVEIRIEGR